MVGVEETADAIGPEARAIAGRGFRQSRWSVLRTLLKEQEGLVLDKKSRLNWVASRPR